MSEAFRALVESTGLKKEKIAKLAGVTPTTVSKWLAGKTPVPPLLSKKLAEIDKVVNS